MTPIDDIVRQLSGDGERYARSLPKYGEYLEMMKNALRDQIISVFGQMIVPDEVRAMQTKLKDMNKMRMSVHSQSFDEDISALHQALEDLGYCPFEDPNQYGGN
jgi:hypothetical protein